MGVPSLDQASVINAIYASIASPDLWPDVLTRVSDHVGADGGMLLCQSTTGSGGFMVTARLRPDLTDVYLDRYTRNPYALALSRLPPDQLVFVNDLAEQHLVRRTAFHADILAPQLIGEMLAVPHSRFNGPALTGGLSFTLPERRVEDRDRAASRLRPLIPHLSRAIDLSAELSGAALSGRNAGLLDLLGGAALIVDGRGRVIVANAEAERLLARGDGLSATTTDGVQLTAAIRAESRLLAKALAGAVATANGDEGDVRGAVRISRPTGSPALFAIVTPLPKAAFWPWDFAGPSARALVQIVDPLASVNDQAQLLKDAAGLTAAETRVATMVGEGRSTPAIAAALGISVATVRTHLARCFDKTGARSQVALTRILAAFPGSSDETASGLAE